MNITWKMTYYKLYITYLNILYVNIILDEDKFVKICISLIVYMLVLLS